MYCSSCGVAVAEALSYCNYCGAKLNGVKGDSVIKSPEVKPEKLVEMMGAIFVCGLIAIIVMMGVMKAVLGLNVGVILAIALLVFLVILLLEGVFIRLLFRGKRDAQEAVDTARWKGQATKELDGAQAGVLPEPLASVTENTTRALESVYTERTPK